MYALQVKELGVKFELHHRKSTTFLETFVNLFRNGATKIPLPAPGIDTLWALRNVTFAVKQGESIGIIGKNGAGKSTLLQVITGIYKPDEGVVERKGKLGLLQLGTGFHPELSGRDNIYLNGAILGLQKKEIDAVYNSIIAFSELERFIDVPIKNYSSGMTARLGFSIAINVRPDILLIDEVLSVGDESFRKKCLQKIDEIRTLGKTVVFVSHSMGEVQRICDRGIFLDQGQIVYQGTSKEAAEFYLEFNARAKS